ncbi:MAG: hypothetical protein IPN60_09530 [Saprospiraceae bacterium]|nr:hypothetical protein [Candidatus Opimibacter skivensis]
MDQSEIINLWKAYDRKLEASLMLNKSNAIEITRLKTKSLLSSMTPLKIFTIIVGMLWVSIGGTIVVNLFVHAYASVSPFFLYSAAFQLLLTAIGIGIYLYQLVLIHQMDITDTLIKTQKRLTQLKSSTLWVARILLLQLPAWTTFYWSMDLIKSGHLPYIFLNSVVTLLAIAVSLWLFVNIRYENREKKWFKLIFEGKEWTPVIKAIELHKEIEAFERE